ncbi:hypothetical protein EYC80_000035 [Monilinia laxa]|uniref:Uncharacterized protein n=1 Tax=Monilinia laxa TaxID=61186 RepID=A0A5N6K9D8_MONLA|nr:hypothetical protein EYC80_000035 [Monilinia laxa]
MGSPSIKNVHFVGSVCLPDTLATFRTLSTTFPSQLKRVPDGEPANRGNFVLWQRSVFYKYPYLVRSLYFSLAKDPGPIPVAPEKIQLMPIGYDDAAIESGVCISGGNRVTPATLDYGLGGKYCQPRTSASKYHRFIRRIGLPLCYGDLGHQYFTQSKDMALLVDIANQVLSGTRKRRSVNWIHMPVPKDRIDRGYFEPLKHLEKNDTEVYLGLLHQKDLEGTKLRIKAASEFLEEFGVASECGLGRADAAELESVLETAKKVTEG